LFRRTTVKQFFRRWKNLCLKEQVFCESLKLVAAPQGRQASSCLPASLSAPRSSPKKFTARSLDKTTLVKWIKHRALFGSFNDRCFTKERPMFLLGKHRPADQKKGLTEYIHLFKLAADKSHSFHHSATENRHACNSLET
jgi:hypothetical protein